MTFLENLNITSSRILSEFGGVYMQLMRFEIVSYLTKYTKFYIKSKVNFFERTNAEYALANKTVDEDVFTFSADF